MGCPRRYRPPVRPLRGFVRHGLCLAGYRPQISGVMRGIGELAYIRCAGSAHTPGPFKYPTPLCPCKGTTEASDRRRVRATATLQDIWSARFQVWVAKIMFAFQERWEWH